MVAPYRKAPAEPLEQDIYMDEDLFAKLYGPVAAGRVVPQHSHDYAHPTLVLWGEWEVWQDGKFEGTLTRGQFRTIPAYTKHEFKCLTTGGMLACLHNLRGKGYPESSK